MRLLEIRARRIFRARLSHLKSLPPRATRSRFLDHDVWRAELESRCLCILDVDHRGCRFLQSSANAAHSVPEGESRIRWMFDNTVAR